MGAVAAVLGVASAGLQVASAYGQSRAERMQGDYEASIARSNARLAEMQSKDAIFRGEREAAEQKRKVRTLIGSQRAALGAQGIEIDSGSALDVQQDTAALGAEDELTIRNNAYREAWGYRAQSADYLNRGAFASLTGRTRARNTLLTGSLGALKTLGSTAYRYGNP